jgi:hypothetical protein
MVKLLKKKKVEKKAENKVEEKNEIKLEKKETLSKSAELAQKLNSLMR